VAGKRNNIAASLHERPDPHTLGKEKKRNKQKSKPNTSLNLEKENTPTSYRCSDSTRAEKLRIKINV